VKELENKTLPVGDSMSVIELEGEIKELKEKYQ